MQHCCILSNYGIFLSDNDLYINDLYIKVKRMVYLSFRLQSWTELLRSTGSPQRFRFNFSPFREVGRTACFRVNDTRCGTYVIYPAYLQSRCSPSWATRPSCNHFILKHFRACRTPIHKKSTFGPGGWSANWAASPRGVTTTLSSIYSLLEHHQLRFSVH